ncbi:MAG TPA: MoaD/ThiS family protein [Microlunatus sp.]
MTQVLLHYWAGARAAAGVQQEAFAADTVAGALKLAADARGDARFAQILAGSTLLLDGRALHDEDQHRHLDGDVTVEVLPPFAGG